MRNVRLCLFVMCVLAVISFAGCGGDDHVSTVSTPIHLEMNTENLQSKVGLSGFILGTFMLLNAYIVIILSCVTLLVKEQTFKKISDTVGLGLRMLNPSQGIEGGLFKVLALLSNGETRLRIGSAGLIIGLFIAYIGAWIAT